MSAMSYNSYKRGRFFQPELLLTPAAAMMMMAPAALGQTAGMIAFQGLIRDNNGHPMNGTVDFEFRIYDSDTGNGLVDMDGDGTAENFAGPACPVTQDDGDDVTEVCNVLAVDGLVFTKLGPVHPIAFDGGLRYLEVSLRVAPDTVFTPLSRIEMVTAPGTAEQVNIPPTGTPAISVDENGNVGIGTTDPQSRIDVRDGGGWRTDDSNAQNGRIGGWYSGTA